MTEETPHRIVDIDGGLTMVVTDLHGEGQLYRRYRDIFLELRARGLAETLVITGDFIHSEGPPERDASLEIALDLMPLSKQLGPALVVLLGNHELPHIYHVTLSKGQHVYTPRFEAAMDGHHAALIDFFAGLPFFARTPAGVTLCHAGAFPLAQSASAVARLTTFSHQTVLAEIAARAPRARRPALRGLVARSMGTPYAELARDYFGVTEPEDPRYDDVLLGFLAGQHPDFQLLWNAFFSRNEHESGSAAYASQIEALLRELSHGYHEQAVLVAGHIGCRNGFRVMSGGRQLRLASGPHAHPYASAKYLLFDAGGAPVRHVENLLGGVGAIFAEA